MQDQQPPLLSTDVLFSYGFRPLFLCSMVSALFYIAWWILVLHGFLPAPHSDVNIIEWHAHEMLFGFVGSAIGGFLLTAVANWTNRKPVQGAELALLVALWCCARWVMAWPPNWPPVVIMLIDTGYFLYLTLLVGREILVSGNLRNRKIVFVLAAFVGANFWFHASAVFGREAGSPLQAIRLGVMLVVMMLTIIGGRIVPAFTRNWMTQHCPGYSLPPAFGLVDQVAAVATGVAGLAWVVAPGSMVTGYILLFAGLAQGTRLARWRGHRTLGEPLLLVLHTGYAWLAIGLALLGFGLVTGSVAMSAGVHGLTIGAMAGMIMAVASRASLGHTGRPLKASPSMIVAFGLVNVAALCRALAGVGTVDWIAISAVAWLVAFALFAFNFVSVLVLPRQVPDNPR